jgi:pimeloyl-ACP methyl ester carboxylesterase
MADLHLIDVRIDTGAAQLYVEEAGGGTPALVFLHYWGGSTRTWHPVMERLAGDARCVAIDHRGWGRSSAPAAGYAIGDLAADAEAVVEALDLDDYILVGHSMGGKVAQLLATRRPAGLRGVVLVAPAPAKPVDIPEAARTQMAAAYASRESVTATLDHVLRHATLGDELREQVIHDSLAGAEPAKREWPAATIVEDVSAGLGSIEVPVLVVAGEHDRVEPVDVMRSHVVDAIRGARLEVIAGSGHLIPLERPAELAEAIAGFRGSLSRRPGASQA